VGIDGRVPSSTRQVFILAVRDVEMSLGVTILLGKTKINDVDLVASLSDAHQEVVRLDITMDEVTGVNVFDARYLNR
jgi:hypothetical protein